MKTKLTLWLEQSTIAYGKRLAARHGTSFSHLVEHILAEVPPDGEPPSPNRWREKFEKAHPIGGPANCTLLADLR